MKIRVGRRTDIVIPVASKGRTRSQDEGGHMYARQTTMSFRVEMYDEGVRLFRDSVVPAARTQKGFRGIYLLTDREAGRAVALTFWDDEAAAVANEQNLYYQEQLVKFLPIYASPPVREGFEVEIEALPAG